jgi:hypothetical protein
MSGFFFFKKFVVSGGFVLYVDFLIYEEYVVWMLLSVMPQEVNERRCSVHTSRAFDAPLVTDLTRSKPAMCVVLLLFS